VARAARTDIRVDAAVGAACVVAALVCMALPTGTRDGFATLLRGSIMSPLIGLQDRAELGRRTFTGHDAAVQLADSVSLRSLRLNGVEQENERLRNLMGLGSALKWGFVPAEALAPTTPSSGQTMLLSQGRRAGIEPLSAVVSDGGLVGVIERADATMSTAMLWLHPEFRVSAMSVDGSTWGLVQAHPGTGADRFFLELRGVQLRSQLDTGALIITSGMGGVWPRGIPIGTVMSEVKTTDQWSRTYLIKPSVALANVGTVLVLRPERARAGVENVWASAAGSDSAARRILSAIDSIARLTGDSSTVRQRRALADSARIVPPATKAIRPDSVRIPPPAGAPPAAKKTP
jgi:rod shape-determining protein MreC